MEWPLFNLDTDNTYNEFGTGAKIWFFLCGICPIILGIFNIITQITSIFNYGNFSLLSVCCIFAYLISILQGIAYFALLVKRWKDIFNIIVGVQAVSLFLNIIISIISDLGIIGVLSSFIAFAINIGITYAVLSKCGGEQLPKVSEILENENTADQATSCDSNSGICCPKCGSGNLQAVSENNTTGGGYSAGKGCCGYMLLGPLGFLCGACGSKTKTTTTTCFVCMNCGHKFAK